MVVPTLFLVMVLASVSFHNKHCFETNEVDEIGSNLTLTPKLQALQAAIAEAGPEPALCFGHRASELSHSRDVHVFA